MGIKYDNCNIKNVNSIKSLYIETCFEYLGELSVISTATGFLVKQDNRIFLLTNRHVVTGKNNFTGEILDKNNSAIPNKLQVYINNEVVTKSRKINMWNNGVVISLYKNNEIDENNKLWIEHPLYKNKIDLIAIDLTDYILKREKGLLKYYKKVNTLLYYKELNNNDNIQVTDQVFVIGFPYGCVTNIKAYLPVWTSGTIASEYDMNLVLPLYKENSNIETHEFPSFLIDSKTREGQSGSPVISYNRTMKSAILLGIYSGRVNANSDLGYVWKTELIKELLNCNMEGNNSVEWY